VLLARISPAVGLTVTLLLLGMGLPSTRVGAAEPLTDMPGVVRLALPPVLYAVEGIESNVYFDNVVLALDPADYVFDVTCVLGRQQSERWTFNPMASDAGDHSFQLDVRNERNEVVARGHCRLRVVAADARSQRPTSILMIGDSLTHASVYPQRVAELFARQDQAPLTLVGSHSPEDVPAGVRHEGYGGWTAERFATHYAETARRGDYRQRGSPFLYADGEGKPQLDFAHYYRDVNAGKVPDFVTIFLGPNDVFSATDETIEATIDRMLTHYESLVLGIQAESKETRIGVMLPVPPTATQDAFGSNYANGQTRWQYRRNQHRLVERLLAQYSGRDAEGIEILPTHVDLDCRHNYPTERGKANAHTEVVIERQNNGVHPDATGYRQIGDTVYAWLKSH
jgi:lysophospholipase L1-like esterase